MHRPKISFGGSVGSQTSDLVAVPSPLELPLERRIAAAVIRGRGGVQTLQPPPE